VQRLQPAPSVLRELVMHKMVKMVIDKIEIVAYIDHEDMPEEELLRLLMASLDVRGELGEEFLNENCIQVNLQERSDVDVTIKMEDDNE
jgi:hypothetical protein